MKTILNIIGLVILSLSSIKSYAQWNIIYTVPDSGYSLLKTQFIDANIGYALGVNSINNTSCIYKTIDGGINWDTTIINKYLFAMDFPVVDTGFVGSTNSLFMRTFDGGNTWEQLPPSVFTPLLIHIKSLAFYNGRIGIASQNGGTYITYNSGNTWQLVSSISFGGVDYGFIDNDRYFASGSNEFLYSFDTLQNCTIRVSFLNGSSGRSDVNNDSIVICGMGQDGWLYNYGSTNFGIISSGKINLGSLSVYHFPELYLITGIQYSGKNIFASCVPFTTSSISPVLFLTSRDYGQTWFLQNTGDALGYSTSLIRNISGINNDTCFAHSEKHIYKTTNAGGALGQQVGFLYETTGIVDEKLNNNFLFPNPATQTISISNIPANSKFKIINLQGITIMESNFNFENEIDVSLLSIGVYFIQIHSGNNIRTEKFLKQ
jgi:hypothetical protein